MPFNQKARPNSDTVAIDAIPAMSVDENLNIRVPPPGSPTDARLARTDEQLTVLYDRMMWPGAHGDVSNALAHRLLTHVFQSHERV